MILFLKIYEKIEAKLNSAQIKYCEMKISKLQYGFVCILYKQLFLNIILESFEMMPSQFHNFHEGQTTLRSSSLKPQLQLFRSTNAVSKPSTSHRNFQCKFHPNNSLHTFCLSPQCMLPMCSTCISIHNQDHEEWKTYGNYKNLEQLITTTIQTIQQQESIIQQLSHEYVADYQEKKLVEQKCKDILDKARMKVHEEIDRIYDRYVIDVQEKINFYNQELDQLYGVVEQALHKMYSELTANKEGLSLFNKDASYSTSPSPLAKPGRTQRPQIYTFTPENTNMNYRLFQQQERNQTKKQDRKIMKILIELQSNNATEVNYKKIEKIRKQIDELKHFQFVMNVNWPKISKYLSNLCQETIQVKSVSEGDKYKGGTQVKIVNENQIGSESSIENNSRDEIGEIMRNTNERISKMQLSSNRVKQSPSKLQNMGNKERKPNFRPQRV